MLSCNGVIVEIGESKSGKIKYGSGRFVDGKWMFGGIETGTNKWLRCLKRVRMLNVIRENIRPGTRIISDC